MSWLSHDVMSFDDFEEGVGPNCTVQVCNSQDFSQKPVQAWSVRLAAPIFAAPVFVEALTSLLVLSVEGLLALFTAGGDIVWSLSLDGQAFATPCVHEGQAFVGTHGGGVSAVRLVDGHLLWRCELSDVIYGSPFLLKPAQTRGWEDRCLLVATRSGVLHVLDAAHGSQLQQAQLEGEVFSSPVSWSSCGERPDTDVLQQHEVATVHIAVGCRDNHVYCFKLQDLQPASLDTEAASWATSTGSQCDAKEAPA